MVLGTVPAAFVRYWAEREEDELVQHLDPWPDKDGSESDSSADIEECAVGLFRHYFAGRTVARRSKVLGLDIFSGKLSLALVCAGRGCGV